MVTLVGTHGSFPEILQDLIELEYDALEAYNTAIDRISEKAYKDKLEEFREDHKNHIKELTDIIGQYGVDVPEGPSMKQWLTSGKVILANLVGDLAILRAMNSNEKDTNTAYERVNGLKDKAAGAVDFLKRAYNDEKRHKAWLESIIEEEGIF